MDKVCKIMRGLPGSGKTTRATLLRKQFYDSIGGAATIISADNYFLRPDGRYSWKGDEVPYAHNWARRELKVACNHDFELVIIDNTNMRHVDYGSYAAIASAAGYHIELEVVGTFPPSEADLHRYAARNCHGVPLESIRRMAAKWEP